MFATILACTLSALAAQSPVDPGEARATYLVLFEQAPDDASIRWIEEELGGTVEHRYQSFPSIAVFLAASQVEALAADPKVVAVDEEQTFYLTDINNTWGVRQIGGGFVHDLGVFGSGVKVGVIDSGIDYTHPELSGVYMGGFDFVFNDNDPFDDNGHGTHVSGTIAAKRDGVGVVGVAPEVDLYMAKSFNFFGSGQESDILAGVDWMTMNGMDVVNNSWGGFGNGSLAMQAAFQAALNAGVIHVAAAGNYGGFGGVKYPARYPTTYAVSALNASNKIAGFSDRGPEIDFGAPGVQVLSSKLGGGYTEFDGTSMACPHVAGTVAAVLSTGSVMDTDGDGNLFNEMKARLAATAIDLGVEGKDNLYGYGLVNAQGALFEPIQISVTGAVAGQSATVSASGGTPGDTLAVAGSLTGPGYIRAESLGVLIGILNPIALGTATVDGAGNASLLLPIPGALSGATAWGQAMETSTNTSSVVKIQIQ